MIKFMKYFSDLILILRQKQKGTTLSDHSLFMYFMVGQVG